VSGNDKPVPKLPGLAVALPGRFVSGQSISDAVEVQGIDDIETHFREALIRLQDNEREAEEVSQNITLR
jgi:hypothetical protein